jgi:Glyoxalase/Bleomycin resistance protein/Dioxygenase superfamily
MRVHHIGYVVHDIAKFERSLPGLVVEKIVEDPLQNATLALYSIGSGSLVELIQPHDSSAYTWAFLDRVGQGLHHICYEGIAPHDLNAVLAKHKLFKVLGPINAVLFDRDVVFAMTRERTIVEFLL